MKKGLSVILAMVLCISFLPTNTAYAAVKISKAKATLEVDATLTLKVTGTEKSIKWASSQKTVAKVSSKGTVTALKAGTTIITATVDNKKYTCEVKVVDSNKSAFNDDLVIGEYLVGDDIPEGKYNLSALKGWGIIYIYKSEKDYESDDIWNKSINLCSAELEKDMYGMYVPEYKNLSLKKGNYIVINYALTVNFKSK